MATGTKTEISSNEYNSYLKLEHTIQIKLY